MKTFLWGKVHPFLLRRLRTEPSTQQVLKHARWKPEWMISVIQTYYESWCGIQLFLKSQSQRHLLKLFLCQMRMAVPVFLSKSFGELEIWIHIARNSRHMSNKMILPPWDTDRCQPILGRIMAYPRLYTFYAELASKQTKVGFKWDNQPRSWLWQLWEICLDQSPNIL